MLILVLLACVASAALILRWRTLGRDKHSVDEFDEALRQLAAAAGSSRPPRRSRLL